MKKICVIGGANVDIYATPQKELLPKDSNPSTISYEVGGAGCNTARNLSLLGQDVFFITVLGKDAFAKKIKHNCKKFGVDTSQSLTVGGTTSTYLCINDENGDRFIGANDMSIMQALTVDYLKQKLNFINSCDLCVIDVNLSAEAIYFLIDSVTIPLFLETVSTAKVSKLKGNLPFAVKANAKEAETLTGITISDISSAEQASKIMHGKGTKLAIITRDKNGSYFSLLDEKSDTKNCICGEVPIFSANVVNTTGAGDAFLAGVVSAYADGKSIRRCVKEGAFCASVALGCAQAVNKNLSKEKIEQALGKPD